MTWDEMHDMVRAAYIEGVKAGIRAVKTQRQLQLTGKITDDELQWMWETSDASRDLPESVHSRRKPNTDALDDLTVLPDDPARVPRLPPVSKSHRHPWGKDGSE